MTDAQISFDVNVTFDSGEKASIEMQGREYDYDYSARSEIEAARLLNNNAKKGTEWNERKMSWYCQRSQERSKINFR